MLHVFLIFGLFLYDTASSTISFLFEANIFRALTRDVPFYFIFLFFVLLFLHRRFFRAGIIYKMW